MSNEESPFRKALRAKFGDGYDRDSAESKLFEAGWDAATALMEKELYRIANARAEKAEAAKLVEQSCADDAAIERVARAICIACDEQPDHVGDARGNACRWQDYEDAARAAIKAAK